MTSSNSAHHSNGKAEIYISKETDPLESKNGGAVATEVKIKDEGHTDVEALDGGYAWVIVFASFWIQFLISLPMVYGVLYVELLEAFESSNADTAWPGSIATGLALGLGPLASVLCNKFGHRATCIAGGVFTAVGVFSSAFVNNIYLLNLTYGVLAGTGMAMAYVPGVVMVGFYFDKKKGLANGLAVTGVGVAGIVIPSLMTYLINVLGWRGCLIIMGGIALNICVMGALLRPLPKRFITAGAEQEDKICEISLLKDWRLLVFILVDFLWNIGGVTWVTLVVDHAIVEGFGKEESALLATVDGIGGVLGKLTIAFLSKHLCCNRLLIFATAIFFSGVPSFLVSIDTSYAALVCYCALYGFSFGVQLGLLPVIILELFGLRRLTSAFGYAMVGDGIGALIGPPIGGFVFDVTKSYTLSFVFGGLTCVASAGLVMVLFISVKCRKTPVVVDEIVLEQEEEAKDLVT
ncbi:monocarboxylate transporter 14-like [Lineus longissimus]|uniref:monocarboxylate transporter 14-like n=1 Tax=Lineus longissimus TaxID=88925 RepID=UPI00315CBFF6